MKTQGGWGGTQSIHDRGGPTYFFGSRDRSRISLGLKKIRIFFWVTSLFFLRLMDQNIFIQTFQRHESAGKTASLIE